MPGNPLADAVDASTSVRTAFTATGHATPFSDGTYVDIDTSLAADANGIEVVLTAATFSSGANTSTLLEFAIDPTGGTTYAAWASIPVGYRANTGLAAPMNVMGFIPAGSRVAMRVRSAVTVKAVTAVVHFLPVKHGIRFGAPITYLADTATARGTTLTAPGSLNTMGADLSLVTSTSVALAALSVGVQAAGGAGMNGSGVLVDIRYDPTGGTTYQGLIENLYFGYGGTEFIDPLSPLCFGVDIPAASRIAARYQRANTGNAVDLILVGTPL